VAGVKIREAERYALRGLTHYSLPACGRAIWEMDTETYPTFVDAYDRSFKQLASDGFIHLIRAGATVDDSVMLGSGAPIIRITVAEPALNAGIGLARIDGQTEPVSIDTVTRLIEAGTTIRVGFDPTGRYFEQAHDRLAENRLDNRKQREILATKYGGCMDPDGDRPPSWCESHPIAFVKRDGGKTTIENAILLCKYHHLKYHNDGYEISQDHYGNYWKIPPATVDPTQTPIPMPLKTRNLTDLRAAEARATAGPAS
jgi:hypothetical protein